MTIESASRHVMLFPVASPAATAFPVPSSDARPACVLLARSLLLHPLEAAPELAIGLPQGRFRIERQIARNVHQHKNRSPTSSSRRSRRSSGTCCPPAPATPAAMRLRTRRGKFFRFCSQFVGFFLQLVEQAFDVRPVEADMCRPRAEFVGFHQCRHRRRNSGQHRFGWTALRGSFRFSAARFFFSSAFSASQLRRTSAEVSAFTSPKTCGCRSTSLLDKRSSTSSMEKCFSSAPSRSRTAPAAAGRPIRR